METENESPGKIETDKLKWTNRDGKIKTETAGIAEIEIGKIEIDKIGIDKIKILISEIDKPRAAQAAKRGT